MNLAGVGTNIHWIVGSTCMQYSISSSDVNLILSESKLFKAGPCIASGYGNPTGSKAYTMGGLGTITTQTFTKGGLPLLLIIWKLSFKSYLINI